LDLSPPSAPSLPAAYYRKHAVRVRELAAETTTPVLKEHLLEIARQYDRLAERADEGARMGVRSA
jgi:hypothetical protein